MPHRWTRTSPDRRSLPRPTARVLAALGWLVFLLLVRPVHAAEAAGHAPARAAAGHAAGAHPAPARPAAPAPRAAARDGTNFPVPRPGSEEPEPELVEAAPAAPEPLAVPPTGPVPVRILPQAFAPERVIQRFRLAPKVTEFMVVLHTPSLEGVRLRTPAGQMISADNIWRVGRWQTGQQLSVISLDWSAAGEWLVLGPEAVPVDVIVDPMLVPVRTPESVGVGEPAVLRWQVQAGGRSLDLSAFAELVVASARVIDEGGGITDLAYAFEPNGVVSLTVPPQGAGVFTVETDIWLATFGQHVMHRLAVVPEPSVQVLGRRAAPMLVVRLPDAGLDTRATRVALDIRSSEGDRQVIVGKREVDGSFRVTVPPGALGDRPARARVVLGADGLTKGGQPWHAPSRLVTLGSQGVAATRVLATGDEDADPGSAGSGEAHDAASGHGEAGGGEHETAAGEPPHAGVLERWLALMLHPAGHGPEPWQYGALGAANIVLVALLWLRHRRRTRPDGATAGVAAADAATPAADAGSRSREPDASGVRPASSGPVAGAAAATRVYDDRSAPEPEAGADHAEDGGADAASEEASPEIEIANLLEGLDADALDSLADLAETQADARVRGRPADDDVDAAA